jgi:hypothetical protein
MYIWKCLNKTPCIAILYKQKCIFLSKTENKKVLSEGLAQWERGGFRERV